MNVEGLEPGPKLDALVAEVVLGRKVYKVSEHHLWLASNNPKDLYQDNVGRLWDRSPMEDPEDEQKSRIFSPSTDIAQAFEVLEHVATMRLGIEYHPDYRTNMPGNCRHGLYKPVIRLDLYEHDDEYSVTIGRCKGVGHDDDVTASVMGRGFKAGTSWAICLAALKVMTKYERI